MLDLLKFTSNKKKKILNGVVAKFYHKNIYRGVWNLELLNSIRNSWVKLSTLENRLAREGYPRAYIHIFKFILKQCGTLGS